MKLVNRTVGYSRDETLPNAGATTKLQRIRAGIPSIKATNDRYFARVRSPYAKTDARLVADRSEVGAQLLVGAVMASLIEKIKILLGQKSHFQRDLGASVGFAISDRGYPSLASVPE